MRCCNSVALSLKGDGAQHKSSAGVDAVKVKRFTVSGDGRICYFYPTKDLFVSSGVIGPGGTTTRTDTETVNALECYDLRTSAVAPQ